MESYSSNQNANPNGNLNESVNGENQSSSSTSISTSIYTSTSTPTPTPTPTSTLQAQATTTTVTTLYSQSAKAFLQRDHLSAILTNQKAFDLLSHPSSDPTSNPTSNPNPNLSSPSPSINKLLILRLTILSTIYSDPITKHSLITSLSSSTLTSTSSSSDKQHRENLINKFNLNRQDFIQELWKETLSLSNQIPLKSINIQDLRPSSETLNLCLSLNSSVLSSCILASISLEDHSKQDQDQKSASNSDSNPNSSSRLISEWFLNSFSNFDSSSSSSLQLKVNHQNLKISYQKVLEIYSVHILGVRGGEWEYAYEIIAYSQLPQIENQALLSKLSNARSEIESRPERNRKLSQSALKSYQEEKSKRDELIEKQIEKDLIEKTETKKTARSRVKGNSQAGFTNGNGSFNGKGKEKSKSGSEIISSSSSSTSKSSSSDPTSRIESKSRRSSTSSENSSTSIYSNNNSPEKKSMERESNGKSFSSSTSGASGSSSGSGSGSDNSSSSLHRKNQMGRLKKSEKVSKEKRKESQTRNQNLVTDSSSSFSDQRDQLNGFIKKGNEKPNLDTTSSSSSTTSTSKDFISNSSETSTRSSLSKSNSSSSSSSSLNKRVSSSTSSQSNTLLRNIVSLRFLNLNLSKYWRFRISTILGVLITFLFIWRRSSTNANVGRNSRIGNDSAIANVNASTGRKVRQDLSASQGGMIGNSVRRIWDTLRMGTQVSYL